MNFLSHFYFDRDSTSPELVLGTVLPDLIKNANKSWILHPEKKGDLFIHDRGLLNILKGWKRHVDVDRYFHCSDFFMEHSKAIRTSIVWFLEDSPVRPSFLSHVTLELILDNLLITEGIVNVDDFYKHLERVNRQTLAEFLTLNDISDPDMFVGFFDRFIESAYLKNYSKPDNIIYALTRICMRLWKDPLNETQKAQLAVAVIDYTEKLRTDFMDIFKMIDKRLE